MAGITLSLLTASAPWMLMGCAHVNASGEVERGLDREHATIGRYRGGRFSFADRNVTIELREGRLEPSPEWALVNVVDPSDPEELISKEGDAWVRELRFDIAGSGIDDAHAFMPRYDLLFRHRVSGASLSVRSYPLSQWARSVSLRALADARIDADSAEMSFAIAQGTSAAVAIDGTERVAVARGGVATRVGRMDAYAFEYTIEDATRYQLSLPQSPYHVRTVFIRPDWRWEIESTRWPVVLEVTLSARDADFSQVASSLDELVARLDLERQVVEQDVHEVVRQRVFTCFESSGITAYDVAIGRNRSGYIASYSVDGGTVTAFPDDSPLLECVRRALSVHLQNERARVVYIQRTPPDVAGDRPAYSGTVWSQLEPPRVTPPAAARLPLPSTTSTLGPR